MLAKLPKVDDPNLLVGFDTSDDAGVYKISDDQAIIDIVLGEAQSYLMICTSELGATTLGMPPRFALSLARDAVVTALRSNDQTELHFASRKYHDILFSDLAREDLAGKTRWTLILPDLLTPIPPAMLLPVDPMPGQPVPWLVRTHVLGLLPHALAGPEIRPVLDGVLIPRPVGKDPALFAALWAR